MGAESSGAAPRREYRVLARAGDDENRWMVKVRPREAISGGKTMLWSVARAGMIAPRVACLALCLLGWMQHGASSPSQTMFDSSGRLSQLENADKAARRGGTVVAMRSSECAVLVSWSPRGPEDRSVHRARRPLHKIRSLAGGVGVSATGIASDVQHVSGLLQAQAQQHLSEFGSSPPCTRLAAALADTLHARSLRQYMRPLGVRVCLVAWEAAGGGRVLEVDTEGNVAECGRTSFGAHGARLGRCLGQLPGEAAGVKELARTCLEAIVECSRRLDQSHKSSDPGPGPGPGPDSDPGPGQGKEGEEEARRRRENVSGEVEVAVVGRGLPLRVVDEGEVRRALMSGDYSPLL